MQFFPRSKSPLAELLECVSEKAVAPLNPGTRVFILVACWPSLNHAPPSGVPTSQRLKFIFRLKARRFSGRLITHITWGRVSERERKRERGGIVGVTGRGSAPSALLIARRVTAAPNISAGDGGVGRRAAPPATKDDANSGRQRRARIFLSGGDDTDREREANES